MRRIVCLLTTAVLLLCAAPGFGEELTEKQLLSYYENCLFVGDSITRDLRFYVLNQRKTDPDYMKGVDFKAADSYHLYIASRKYLQQSAVNLVYHGTEMPLCEIVGYTKPKRVLILLGVNDYIGKEIGKGIGYCERIVDLIADSSPDTQVIFQSLTPVTPRFCRKADYRTMWDEYNAALEEMCREKGAGYIDIASRLKDEEGYLAAEYSQGDGYHLNPAGIALWVDALKDYAQAQYDAGLWTPED